MTGKRGFTLIHCLLFLTVVMILGGASLRMTIQGTLSTLRAHWGRTAEALADGALEMALAELEKGGNERTLDAVLSTGVASAQIVKGSGENHYRIVFQGTVAAQGRIRASRTYKGEVIKGSEGTFEVISIRRL